MNKYRNKKTIVDDYIFDSIQESKRYKELKLLLNNYNLDSYYRKDLRKTEKHIERLNI